MLSTYNGAAYVQQQLQSLVTQTIGFWTVYWRDDGSSDATVAIMSEFTTAIGSDRCIRIVEPAGRVGPAASFLALLKAVVPALGPRDTVAFADQDDVWHPDKLMRGLAALAPIAALRPALYCARVVITNANLNRLAETSISQQGCGFPASLTQNVAAGCTIVLNRRAAELVANSVSPNSSPHDWWSYILVSSAGGRIVVDNSTVALYRQHKDNLIGVRTSRVRRAVAAMHRGRQMYMNILRQHVEALFSQPDLICEFARPVILQLHGALHGNFRQRLRALMQLPDLRRQSWIETLVFRLWFLTG